MDLNLYTSTALAPVLALPLGLTLAYVPHLPSRPQPSPLNLVFDLDLSPGLYMAFLNLYPGPAICLYPDLNLP